MAQIDGRLYHLLTVSSLLGKSGAVRSQYWYTQFRTLTANRTSLPNSLRTRESSKVAASQSIWSHRFAEATSLRMLVSSVIHDSG